jgi:hypothetical protein
MRESDDMMLMRHAKSQGKFFTSNSYLIFILEGRWSNHNIEAGETSYLTSLQQKNGEAR